MTPPALLALGTLATLSTGTIACALKASAAARAWNRPRRDRAAPMAGAGRPVLPVGPGAPLGREAKAPTVLPLVRMVSEPRPGEPSGSALPTSPGAAAAAAPQAVAWVSDGDGGAMQLAFR